MAVLPCFAREKPASAVPFTFRDGLVWIKVSVPGNKQPLNFLLDSGAGATVLSMQAARRLALKFGEAEAVQGVEGSCAARWVHGFTAEFAGRPLPSRLLAIDLASASAVCHQPIDGLVGADFLRAHIVQVDFATRQMAISNDAGMTRRGETLRLQPRNDGMCVCAKIGGRDGQWLRVDTGFDQAVRWFASPSATKPNLRGRSVGVSDSRRPFAETDLQLGALRFDAVKTGLQTRESFPGEAGLLGNGLLAKFKVTFDFGHRRLVLETPQ